MEWVAIVAPAAASLLTLFLANQHSSRIAERASAEARERLRFEAAQSRYADRREAVIAFDQIAEAESDSIADFEKGGRDCGLSAAEVHDDYRFKELMAAHTRVVILTNQEVTAAATAVKGAILDLFRGREEAWASYMAAMDQYREVSRNMLSGDAALGETATKPETARTTQPNARRLRMSAR